MLFLDYQDDAIRELSKTLFEEGIHQDPARFSFEDDFLLFAPVGSGKTYIAARTMVKLMDTMRDNRRAEKIAFAWLSSSMGGLCEQSKARMEGELRAGNIAAASYEDILRDGIQPGKCYFLPYESLRSDANVANRGGDSFSFEEMCEKNEDVLVVAFADEAHADLKGDKTTAFVKRLRPCCLVEITATPDIKDRRPERVVKVDVAHVAAAHMIKTRYNIQNLPDGNYADISDEHLIAQTVEMQNRKKDAWAKVRGSDPEFAELGTPKVMIQLGSEKLGADKFRDSERKGVEKIVALLEENGVEPSKVYVWMADNEKGTGKMDGAGNAGIDVRDFATNDAEYLIFKFAVAKGWDCPSASTLLRLRPSSSNKSFDIQTFGRIGRSALPGKFFDEPLVDEADIFTNDAAFSIDNTVKAMLGQDAIVLPESRASIKPEFAEYASAIRLASQKGGTPKEVWPDAEMLDNKIRESLAEELAAYAEKDYRTYQVDVIESLTVDATEAYHEKGKLSARTTRAYDPAIDDPRIEYKKLLGGIHNQETILRIVKEVGVESFAGSLGSKEAARREVFERLITHWDEHSKHIREIAKSEVVPGKRYETVYRIPAQYKTDYPVTSDTTNFLYDQSPAWSNIPDENHKKGTLESRAEVRLVKYLIDCRDVLFWFINNAKNKDGAFSIWYDDDTNEKVAKKTFYPDFGVMLKNGAFVWLETKGGETRSGKNNEAEQALSACKSRDIGDYVKRFEDELFSYTCEGVNKDAYIAHGIRMINPINVDLVNCQLRFFRGRSGYDEKAMSIESKWGDIAELFDMLKQYPTMDGFPGFDD